MALPELLANSPVPGSRTPLSTLGAPITDPAAVTITTIAAAPSALQGTGQFRIVIDSEILIVTGGASGTTWTVTRGAEGSTAATHANGATVFHYLTAGGLGAMFVATAWDGGTFYQVGKRVIRANAVFECILAHTNHDPFTDCATVLSGTYWQFVSLRGAVENYVSGAETVTATSLTLAPTPDQATVYCPGGMLYYLFAAQWKLTGAGVAASSAQVQIDGAAVNAPALNGGSNTEGTNTLAATGAFWGIVTSSFVTGPTGNTGGALASSPSASSDATVIAEPSTAALASTNPVGAFLVTPGVHTLSVLYAAGNGTTTVNVRDRRLKAFGQ